MWELPLGSGHSWRGFAHVRPCRTLWWGSPRFAVRRVVAESAVACCWDASGMCWRAFPHGDMQLHVPIKHEVRWSGKRRKQNGLDFCVDAQKQFLMNGWGYRRRRIGHPFCVDVWLYTLPIRSAGPPGRERWRFSVSRCIGSR